MNRENGITLLGPKASGAEDNDDAEELAKRDAFVNLVGPQTF